MKNLTALALSVLCTCALACQAQETLPDAPAVGPADLSYSPPTQGERLRSYWKHTYGLAAILEGGVRGGIEQLRNEPTQWPQGGQGYADRFGSSMGQIAVRGTTEYVMADLFREDLRFTSCAQSCPDSTFRAALEDTFFARRGTDGHEALSVARVLGPWASSSVAIETWYPTGYGRAEIVRQAGFSYAFQFIRSYFRELRSH